jgi:hypothetical protein
MSRGWTVMVLDHVQRLDEDGTSASVREAIGLRDRSDPNFVVNELLT